MDFVARKEHIIFSAPALDLGLDNAILGKEVTSFCLHMLYPDGACLDVAIVILLTSEDEDIEGVRVTGSVLRVILNSFNLDAMHRLSDICAKIVIVQTFS